MSMKEFWDEEIKIEHRPMCPTWDACVEAIKYDLGMKLWERGGKQFVQFFEDIGEMDNTLNEYIKLANSIIDTKDYSKGYWRKEAQDFLDCLACLGEDKVKEIIKDLEGVRE